MKTICVLGLGYIGLPTAAMFATHGLQVIGVDINDHIVELLNNGDIHIQEPGLKTLVQAATKSGNLCVNCRPGPADAFIIAVPTPFKARPEGRSVNGRDEHPVADLRFVISAAESIVPHLRPGNLVILESTVPPRTTEDVLLPILGRSGLKVARTGDEQSHPESLLVAHCPERVLPGHIMEELIHNDRVIGGANPASAALARELYSSFVVGQIFLTDATTAEMVKLMENTYRDVNIALANEFALVAEQVGINVWEAIRLANRHPRVRILQPGPGVGGHCIAVDPWFIAQIAPSVTPLIQSARRVNDAMPAYWVGKVQDRLNETGKPLANSQVLVLGVTYKKDIDDLRESPALHIIQLLKEKGVAVSYHDPYILSLNYDGVVMESVSDLGDMLRSVDCVVIATDHRVYDWRALQTQAKLWVDTRNVFAE